MTQRDAAHTRDIFDAPMRDAIAAGDTARLRARPNPWVGAVLVCTDGSTFSGATEEPGHRHAEIVAIDAARATGATLTGATLYVTLEPCSHVGRTGPCCEAIVAAGITTVIAGIEDPDTRVSGAGFTYLRNHNVEVVTGVCAQEIEIQLAPYIHHRRTGRPFVMLKMACTLDARTTQPDGPRWITGESARVRVHELRAESDAIVVGIGTVLADDPALTVRDAHGPSPRRIVVSRSQDIPHDAAVQPAMLWNRSLDELLDHLGNDNVVQLMVESGPTLATAFHSRGLIDRYVFHVAPVISGHPDAAPVFYGEPCTSIEDLIRGQLVAATRFDDDIEIILQPHKETVTV
jgi:diaminohydroxyphosphoribosylaminopyrimidine deaminase / 5-amino-6-(5-phosphoribosylamino)uracil reductase